MKKRNIIEKTKNIRSKIWSSLLVSLLFFIYFIPKEILYPKYKYIDWIVGILILIILPYFVIKLMYSINYKINSTKLYGICALSILIVGPTFGIFQNYREKKELEKKGKITECYVIDRKKSKNDWLINCKYYVDNSEFVTYYHTDEENALSIGDTLKISYNKEYPRMYNIEFQNK